jgi:hypothetical protein
MINNVLKAKTREYTSRGLTTEKISVKNKRIHKQRFNN